MSRIASSSAKSTSRIYLRAHVSALEGGLAVFDGDPRYKAVPVKAVHAVTAELRYTWTSLIQLSLK